MNKTNKKKLATITKLNTHKIVEKPFLTQIIGIAALQAVSTATTVQQSLTTTKTPLTQLT